MSENIEKILQLAVEEFVIKGCTEGLITKDYFRIKSILSKYNKYKDNEYYKKLEHIISENYFLKNKYDDYYIMYVLNNSSLLPFVLANNMHDEIRLYSADSFMFLCQFHKEKTPSLGITNSKNLMYCFGCGIGGNILSYLQEYENMTFHEALSLIAQVYNLESPNIKVNKNLIDKYKESIISDRYIELIEQGIERFDKRKERGFTTIRDSIILEAYNKNLRQRQAIIENKTIEDYPKDKIYTKVYLDSSYLK